MKNSREMFEDYYRPHFGITEQWNERGPRGTYNNESLQSMFEGFHAAYQALQSELEKVKAELVYYKNGTRIKEIHYDEHLVFELAAEKAKSEKLVEALRIARKGLIGETRLEIVDEALAAYKENDK